MGEDLQIKDWKKASNENLKSTSMWHFKINACKRIIIKRARADKDAIVVKGEQFYRSDCNNFRTLLKRGKNVRIMNADTLLVGIPIKPDKKRMC